MKFTAEVKKEDNPEFSIDILRMTHQECGGGEIKAKREAWGVCDFMIVLTCKRCQTSQNIYSKEDLSAIAKLGLTGGKFSIESSGSPGSYTFCILEK